MTQLISEYPLVKYWLRVEGRLTSVIGFDHREDIAYSIGQHPGIFVCADGNLHHPIIEPKFDSPYFYYSTIPTDPEPSVADIVSHNSYSKDRPSKRDTKPSSVLLA
jgi:hypothetical protein